MQSTATKLQITILTDQLQNIQSKNNVNQAEAEQVYFNQPLIITPALKHSQLSSISNESRFHAFGKTDNNRRLHISFTLRSNQALIKPISSYLY